MGDKTYKFDLKWSNMWFDLLKQKENNIILSIFKGSRLVDDMSFAGYGEATFDEKNDPFHWHISIETTEKFNRNKHNCMVFDLKVTDKNPGLFDKCFIFKTTGSLVEDCHIMFLNSENGKSSQQCFMKQEIDHLFHMLNKTLNEIHLYKKYNVFS